MSEIPAEHVELQPTNQGCINRALGIVGSSLIVSGALLLDVVGAEVIVEAISQGNVEKAVDGLVVLAVGGSTTVAGIYKAAQYRRKAQGSQVEGSTQAPDFSGMTIAEQKKWVIEHPSGSRYTSIE